MKVKLISDFEGIPQGSVLQNVTETRLCYNGLWCSMAGSYKVIVPKSFCERIE